MIRFVPMSEHYWLDPEGNSPVCSFFDTVTDRFLTTDHGTQLFYAYDINAHPAAERMWRLVPPGFFPKEKT